MAYLEIASIITDGAKSVNTTKNTNSLGVFNF